MPQDKQARWLQSRQGRRAFVAMDFAILTALTVFLVDLLTNLHGAIAVLYIAVPLLLATAYSERVVILAGLGCGLLATIAFLSQHYGEEIDSAYTRFGVSIAALAVTTFLTVRQMRTTAEREEARARLAQASADLAHAARVSMVGQLAASIAHEVNQPLTAIVAFAKSGKRWLGREKPEMAEAEQCLDRIVESGTRAADVIARMRSMVRKSPAQVEAVDLSTLVDETVALLSNEASNSDVVILRREETGLPLAWADRVQVQQVLVNLLLNAIQAMRSVGGRERQLIVELSRDRNEMVWVEVRDSGTGIADLANVFSPFFTTKRDGMGMGLSISRSIVEAQGGSIQARNNEDFGAAFSFSLPTADSSAAGEPQLQTSV